MPTPRTYSFKAVSFTFSHPLAGSFVTAGQVGLGRLAVQMARERTARDAAADGTIMVSYLAGNDGTITVEVQQTSAIHTFLLSWYNLCQIAADTGDVSNWAAALISILSLTDTSQHNASGVSPVKVNDKPYAAQGEKVIWTLSCADISSTSLV